jgi:hypothetical protein
MELDPEARRILELTRAARTPSARDKLRVEQALARSLKLAAIAGAAGASSATVSKSAGATLATKWSVIVAVPALAVAAASYVHFRPPAGAPSAAAPARALTAPAPAGTPEAPAPSASNTSLEAAPAAPEVRAETPRASAPANREPAPRTPRAPEKPRAEGDSLNQELDLLHEAQAKWRGHEPAKALALLAQHRQRFPKSVLGPEREALRVLSLCAAGRTAEAKAVARRSFENSPRSPLRASLEQSCIKR